MRKLYDLSRQRRREEKSGVERREGMGAKREPGAFLALFRQRSLAREALRLSFAAVLVGEAARWLTVAINARYRLRLPVLSIAPFFLAALVLGVRSRWSPRVTAHRADRALALRDRLTSFVDFSSRSDVPAAFREAQARETAGAIARHLPLRVPRLPWYLALGPVLLVASTIYPLLSGGGPPRDGTQVTGRHYPEAPFTDEDKPADGSPGQDKEPLPEPPGTTGDQQADDQKKEPSTADPRLPALPEGDPRTLKEGDPARRPVTDTRQQEASPLQSFQQGQRLSRVVDLRPGKPAAARAVPRSGSTFRLFPSSDKKGAEGRAGASGSSPGEISVDLSSVPERYRPLVERYFQLLGEEG